MFTGLIEQNAIIVANTQYETANRLQISGQFEGLQAGESIAVNGVCLTLLPGFNEKLCFDVSPETLACTTLGSLLTEDCVNLERAMHAASRFGGHYVSGHVDSTLSLISKQSFGDCLELELGGFTEVARDYLLLKGSITIDGVSLTINEVSDLAIKVLLVPHTLAKTTLGGLKIGQSVNVEFDYLTRVIAHKMSAVIKAMAPSMKLGVTAHLDEVKI